MVEDDYIYTRDQTTSGKIVAAFDSGSAEETFSRKRKSIPTYRVSAIAVMACISIWGLGYIVDMDPFARASSVPELNHECQDILRGWQCQPIWLVRVACGRYPSGFS